MGAQAGIGGSILQLGGQISSKISQARQAGEQARLYRQQAKDIQNQRNLEYPLETFQYKSLVAENEARAAASGISPFRGSPLEVALQNAFQFGLLRSNKDYATKLAIRNAKQGAAYSSAQIPGMIAGGVAQGMGTIYQAASAYGASGGGGSTSTVPSSLPTFQYQSTLGRLYGNYSSPYSINQ